MKNYITKEEKAIIIAYVNWCKVTKHEPDGRNMATLLEKFNIESINDLIDKYMAEKENEHESIIY